MTQKLSISFRQKQLYWENDPYDPITVDCDIDGQPTYVHAPVASPSWTDVTEYTEGLDKLKLSWQATGGESESGSLGSNDLGSNYQKGVTLDLRFTGPAFDYIYGWLMTNPCQNLNAVEVLITDLDCAKSYRVFEIKLDNVKYAPFDEPCIVAMVLREKDDTIHVFQKTIIEDDWQGWFNSDGAGIADIHPNFIYIVEKKPNFILSALIVLTYFVSMVQTHSTLAYLILHDDFKRWVHKVLGISFFCPAPLIRSYITNICDKYGFTYNTMFDDDPANLYRDVCLFYPVEKFQKDLSDGFTSPDTKFMWDNRTGYSFSIFLDKLKKVFNAEWYVTPNNELVFQPRSYFLNQAAIYDFTQPGAYPLYNFFYEFNGQKKPAYGDYNYRIDPQDTCSNDLKWRYNSIVDFDGPANNPMLEGHITKEFDFGCTSFMYDGATEDWLEESIETARLVAIGITIVLSIYLIALNPFTGTAIAIFLIAGWIAANVYIRKFINSDNLRGAVRTSSNVINVPRLLLWDRNTPINDAKVVRMQDPVLNPYYNTEGNNYYQAHPAFDADAGYFGEKVVDIPNYPMVIDEDFFGNLYDRFHESDNPLKNPEVNQTWSADVDFCCAIGDLLGFWEGDFVKIGATVILENRNGRIISGRITGIAADYDKGVVNLTGVVLKSVGVENVITPLCPGDTPAVTSIVNNPDGSITVQGTATPLTVIKVYGSDTEFGVYTQIGNNYTAQNLIDGLIILPENLVGTNQYFKVTSTTTNCDYGFSNAVNHTIVISCADITPAIQSIEIDGTDYILKGAGIDGATIRVFGSSTEDGTYTQIGPDHTEEELEAGITLTTDFTWFKIGATDASCDYGLSAAVGTGSVVGGIAEIIFFTDLEASVIVLWDAERKAKFGEYPSFDVYTTDGGVSKITVDIQADISYPDTTQFELFTSNVNGYIVIK